VAPGSGRGAAKPWMSRSDPIPTCCTATSRATCSERTLRRWLTDDAAFKAEYDSARQALYDAGMGRQIGECP